MEKAKQDAFDNARLQVIKDGYERAFDCLHKALTEDEAGHRGRALELYQQGRQHLLRATSVPSQGGECVGSSWDAARQMQEKMRETLNNITTRLAILETRDEGADADGGPGPGVAAGPQGLYPKLSTDEKPGKPKRPVSPLRPSRGPGVTPVPPAPLRPAGTSPAENPPAYSPQAADGHLSISYGTESGEHSLVGQEFYSQKSNSAAAASSSSSSPTSSFSAPSQSLGEEAEELLFLPHGVQLFFVTPDGQVSAPSYPGVLRLVRFTGERPRGAPSRPPAFLQVCDWLYPLMASETPALLCNTGVYMFPDMMAAAPGSYVGVVLSAELPAADRELFQDLLAQMTDLRVQPPDEAADSINLSQKVPLAPQQGATSALVPARPRQAATGEEDPEENDGLPEWSERVASGILTGASWLSWGLVKGAEYTNIAIQKGASKLREHITPEDTPTQVSPSVAKSLQVAKQATGGAVRVSQFLVDGVVTVAGCVGREMAPHVKKHGGKLIPESMKKDKDGRSNIEGAMVVAASGVQGFATMWTGLECAAKNITTNVASETVTTVKHKYGSAAGQATDLAMNSAINVGVTAFNIDNLGIKAVVKRTGKQTAAALLEDYKLQDAPGQEKQMEKFKK
ncbi:spartin b isoform X1 [Gadus macrocephalus]|uniref:spartin b isoform X1 n=1 Tax=Gadus macrocephalus TaxID=80720 RepID=UPI0028CBAA0F|nr:spartin b isoform X1 [Gadus macrocephalus]